MKFKSSALALLVLGFSLFLQLSCEQGPSTSTAASKVELRKTDQGYRIFVNDSPFYIQGAGLGIGDMEALASHGANAFRTWRTSSRLHSGREILDKAQELGLMVVMGIDVGKERSGFDYNDSNAVNSQLMRIRKEVEPLKDHPALLMWAIGNELNHHATNPKVWDAVNEISRMIHDVDPNHLTTSPLAGMNALDVEEILKRAPDLDLLSIQMYGEIEILEQRIRESNYKGPLMITEWGATGYWEVAKTDWGAPLENNSSVKADFYNARYRNSIEANSNQVVGSFVFLWGQKQERTPTWFGMFMPDGKETESIDVMHRIWQGEWPENRSPRINSFKIDSLYAEDNVRLKSKETYTASIDVFDPDKDELYFHWEIRHESESKATGGDPEEVPRMVETQFSGGSGSQISFVAPEIEGPYRLFIVVEDSMGHAAHANIPFWLMP